jgi:hypothetical protein
MHHELRVHVPREEVRFRLSASSRTALRLASGSTPAGVDGEGNVGQKIRGGFVKRNVLEGYETIGRDGHQMTGFLAVGEMHCPGFGSDFGV